MYRGIRYLDLINFLEIVMEVKHPQHPKIMQTIVNLSFHGADELLDRMTPDKLEGREREEALVDLTEKLDQLAEFGWLVKFPKKGELGKHVYSPLAFHMAKKIINDDQDKKIREMTTEQKLEFFKNKEAK